MVTIKNPRKIAFIGSHGIGDFVVSVPMLRKLKEVYSTAQIDYLTVKTPHKALFLESPYIDALIEIDKRSFWNLFLDIVKMRKMKFDLVIAPFPSKAPSKVLTKLVRTKHLVESKCDISSNENIVEKGFFTLSLLGIDIRDSDKRLEWPFNTKKHNERINYILRQNRISNNDLLIVVHVGFKEGFPHRLWLPDRWAEVINYLTKKHENKVIFIGAGNDEQQTKKVISLLNSKDNIVNLINKLNIKETAALIEKCNLFVSTNSGPMWIAAALHKPQIALCGPSFLQWDPYNKNAIVVRKIIDRKYCNPPCDAKKCRYGDNLCMEAIKVKDVTSAIE